MSSYPGYIRPAHYDPVEEKIIEPLSQLSLEPRPANPGDENTIWVNSTNGHLMRGEIDLEPFEYEEYQFSTTFGGYDASSVLVETSPAINVYITKLGNVVNIHIPSNTTNTVNAGICSWRNTTAVPTRFRCTNGYRIGTCRAGETPGNLYPAMAFLVCTGPSLIISRSADVNDPDPAFEFDVGRGPWDTASVTYGIA